MIYDEADRTATKVPDAIGPFRISRQLGRGGMGVVYQGTHRDTGVQAAVKTIASAAPSAMFAIRREINSLGRLRHPGVVRIIGSGVSGGSPWYAMELLVGTTLRDYLPGFRAPASSGVVSATVTGGFESAGSRDGAAVASTRTGPPPVEGIGSPLSVLASVCDALSYLHENGIVHRDLKPENIFIQASGPPVLVDLGISSEFAGSQGRERIDGAWFSRMGTLAYMAPEQIRGELVDARADLYAVGCILYEYLTGRRVFAGRDSFALRNAQLTEAPIPPSTFVPDIPPELAQLVLQLLEKEPADRIGYADDVAGVLRSFSVPVPRPTRISATYLYRPPLVGRERATEQLSRSIHLLARNGTGGAVFLSGEGGVGKTRLANEAVLLASRDAVTVIVGQCSSLAVGVDARSSDAPLQAFSALLLAIADACRGGNGSETERLLGAHGRLLAPYQPALQDVPGFAALPQPEVLDGHEARARVLATGARAIVNYTSTRPVLLVIDDLQWADELSLGLMGLLIEGGLSSSGLLVVGTYRVDEAPAAVRTLAHGPGSTLIELERFSGSEVRTMVHGMLALRSAEAALVDYVTQQSNGNPFFIVEHLRTAIAERLLSRDERGRWQVSRERSFADGAALPRTLAELVQRRLLQLGADARQLVEVASVLGRKFDAELLTEASELSNDAVSEAWALLCERQIFEDCEGGQWRFVHDGLRQAAYSQVDPETLAHLHHRAAATLESLHSETTLEPFYADLAHHYAKARLPEQASSYFEYAGLQARRAFATVAAVRHFQCALTELSTLLGSEAAVRRARIQEALGELLLFEGDAKAASLHLEAAIAATDRADRVLAAGRLRKLARVMERQHRHGDALDVYRRAELELGEAPDGDSAAYFHELVQIQVDTAWDLYFMARVDELDALAARVQPIVERHGDAAQRSRFFTSMAQSLVKRARFRVGPQALRYTELALAVSEESTDPRERAVAEFARAFPLTLSGDYAQAEPLFLRAAAGAERVGDTALLTRVLAYFGVMLRRAERVPEVRAVAQRSSELALRMRMQDYLGVSHANLAWVAHRSAQTDDCERNAARALDSWAKLPSSYVFPLQWLARLPYAAHLCGQNRVGDALSELSFLLRQDQMALDDDLMSEIARQVQVGSAGTRQEAHARSLARGEEEPGSLEDLLARCRASKYL